MGALLQLRTDLDSYTTSDENAKPFREWHVEALLAQASDLLDRCMSMRNTLRGLEEKQGEVWLRARILESDLEAENGRLQSEWFGRENAGFQAALPIWTSAYTRLDNARQKLRQLYQANFNAHDVAADYEKAEAELDFEAAARSIRQQQQIALPEESARQHAHAQNRYHAGIQWLTRIFVDRTPPLLARRLVIEDQIDAAVKCISADFKDAFDRCTVAQIGLRKFYGHDEPLPRVNAGAEIGLIDETMLWVRARLTWLSATLQYEQVFSSVYSLRKLLGESKFIDFRNTLGSAGRAECTFLLDGAGERGFTCVRLRGISAVAIGDPDLLLSGDLLLPRRAFSQQYRSGALNKIEVDQGQLPSCRLGRIESSRQSREPEISGGNSLINASPFSDEDIQVGRHTFTITQISGGGGAVLEDIRIEFILAGLPV